MNLVVWPYLNIENQWTMNNQMLDAVWNRIVELNRVEATWYDGSVKTKEEFITFMRNPYNFPTIIVSADKIRFWLLAWLNDFTDGTAMGHFCFLDRYHPEITTKILDHWKQIDSLRVITGITPESYKQVLKIIDRVGFHIIKDTIPQICNMHYENRREGGVVSYYLTKGEDNGRE